MFDAYNSTDKNIIKFQGENNVLTIRGNNTLTNTATSSNSALVNSGKGLVVQGDLTASLTIDGNRLGAGIGSDAGQACGDIGICDAIVNVKCSNNDLAGAGIGSGSNGGAKCGDIQIENSDIAVTSGTLDSRGWASYGAFHACVGSGSNGAKCGNILVVDSNVTTQSVDTGIGAGYLDSECGNIDIANSVLEIRNRDSACVGGGDGGGKCGNIRIYPNTIVNSFSEHGAGIGTGRSSYCKEIIIGSNVTINHTSHDGAVIGGGLNGHIKTIRINGDTLANIDPSNAYIDEEQLFYPNSGVGKGRYGDPGIEGSIEYPVPGRPLVIHHGTKASQALNCYIEDMQTNSLKGEIPTEVDDYDLAHDPSLKAILNEAEDMSIADAKVTTQHEATVAIRVIDGALDYALNEATRVGSYISRLDFTEENLVTANENTQASESTIRDADMAREMTEYTKSNVLAQAAQSMLAQANQNSSSVLSLLQ